MFFKLQTAYELRMSDWSSDVCSADLRNLYDWHRRGVVVQDQRRCGAWRQLLDHRLRDRGHLRIGHADIDIRLEEDLDDAEAVVGGRLDMLDIVDCRCQRALDRKSTRLNSSH